jgi:hypothetical protein
VNKPLPVDRRTLFPRPNKKSALILADLQAGILATSEIARKHRCSPANVSAVRSRAVERDLLGAPSGDMVVRFPGASMPASRFRELRVEARLRGVSVEALIRTIVNIVIRDDLFAAVLGDGPE